MLSNHGIVRTYRYEFMAAIADHQEAERLSERLGLELSIAWTHQNLGFAHVIRGDLLLADSLVGAVGSLLRH